MSDELITTTEAAIRLGIEPDTVRSHIRKKNLPAEKKGRDWLIDPADLDLIRNLKPGVKPGSARKKKPDESV